MYEWSVVYLRTLPLLLVLHTALDDILLFFYLFLISLLAQGTLYTFKPEKTIIEIKQNTLQRKINL